MQLADVEAQILHKTYKDDEDGMLYDVKGVRMLKDRTMVADIAMHGSSKKLRTPIHVADVIRMIRAMDGAVLSTSALHRAIQERDNGAHEAALHLESMSPHQQISGVILESVDDIPTWTDRKSPYGEVSMASEDMASEAPRHGWKRPYGGCSMPSEDAARDAPRQSSKSPYGGYSLPSEDAARDAPRQSSKSPYGESRLLPDIVSVTC
jgi:hypothetical protein